MGIFEKVFTDYDAHFAQKEKHNGEVKYPPLPMKSLN